MVAVGLIVDRIIGPRHRGPTVVQGAPEGARRLASASTQGVRTGESPGGAVLAPARFPKHLPAAEAEARDLFGLTDVVKRALLEAPAAAGAAALNGAPTTMPALGAAAPRLEPFSDRHTVSAVVCSDGFARALVDGVWVRIGQQVDGCELVRISGRTAFFRCGKAEVELSVDAGEEAVSGSGRNPAAELKAEQPAVDNPVD